MLKVKEGAQAKHVLRAVFSGMLGTGLGTAPPYLSAPFPTYQPTPEFPKEAAAAECDQVSSCTEGPSDTCSGLVSPELLHESAQ